MLQGYIQIHHICFKIPGTIKQRMVYQSEKLITNKIIMICQNIDSENHTI